MLLELVENHYILRLLLQYAISPSICISIKFNAVIITLHNLGSSWNNAVTSIGSEGSKWKHLFFSGILKIKTIIFAVLLCVNIIL